MTEIHVFWWGYFSVTAPLTLFLQTNNGCGCDGYNDDYNMIFRPFILVLLRVLLFLVMFRAPCLL